MTKYKAPHYSNLKARARKLGLIITKTTDADDARMFGGNEYVLHKPGQDWENMRTLALRGIMVSIEEREAAAARGEPEQVGKVEIIPTSGHGLRGFEIEVDGVRACHPSGRPRWFATRNAAEIMGSRLSQLAILAEEKRPAA